MKPRPPARPSPTAARLLAEADALHRAGRTTDAIDAYARTARADPRNADVHIRLAMLHASRGDDAAALDAWTRAAWLDRKNVYARLGLANLHERHDDLDRAASELDAALAIDPHNPYARILRARLATRTGRPDDARAELDTLLAERHPDDVRYRAAYQLARVLERLGLHDDAFAAAQSANAAHARTAEVRAVDPRPWLHKVAQAKTLPAGLFRRAAARAPLDHAPPSRRPPVFLVGFPRSGTTLTEQILFAHPDVAVTNEADLLSPLAATLFDGLDQRRPMAELLEGLPDDRIAAARAAYRAAAAPHLARTPGATLLVDKHPMNIVSLGIINIAFPEARIIHALRDPRDACVSCLFQSFVPNPANVHFLSIDGTVALYRTVMDLFLHQRGILTLDVLESRYERLVAEPEPGARRLLEFLDLPWDPAVLRFHERSHRRPVGTPSYEAVRTPVHTRAVARWTRYRAHIRPMLDALAPYADAFGYDPAD